jgi:hypothetical protein
MGIIGLLPILSTALDLAGKARERYAEKSKKASKKELSGEAPTLGAKAWKAVMDTVGGIPGLIAGAIAAAAVAAMVLGGIFGAISIASGGGKDEDEEKEAKLAEKVSNLTATLNEAKEAAENFKSSINDYDSGIEALSKLE